MYSPQALSGTNAFFNVVQKYTKFSLRITSPRLVKRSAEIDNLYGPNLSNALQDEIMLLTCK